MRKPPTADELRRLGAEGLSYEAIGERLDLSRQRIYQLFQKHGLTKQRANGGGRPNNSMNAANSSRTQRFAANIAAVRRCAEAGRTAAQTAAETGLSIHTVYKYSSIHDIFFTAKEPAGMAAVVARRPSTTVKVLPPKPRKVPRKAPRKVPPKRRRPVTTSEPLDCRICERAPVAQRTALQQLGEHPGKGHVWPRCRRCREKIDGHVAVFQAKIAARQGAPEEGW